MIEFTEEELENIHFAIAVVKDNAKYIKPSTEKALDEIQEKIIKELYHKEDKE